MSNLTKNIITRGAVVALALSAGAATTANAAVTRTAGADRFSTATEIFKAWPTTTDTAILAAGVGHDVDALTVAPLAKMKNAPIILVDATAATATIVAQFTAFKTVYIANGTGVISQAVETALTAAGKTVVRLGGTTRTDTALIIAKLVGTANGIVVANGTDEHIVDTLSIASIAASKGMPIFLTENGSLSAAETTYAKGLAATNVYALGGTGVVTDAAVTGLATTITRLGGADRYATNAKVVTNFKADLNLANIYVASGTDDHLIDSLAGAPLAGLKNAPIVFADSNVSADVSTFLNSVVIGTTNLVILGGTGAVTTAAETALLAIQAAHSSLIVASVAVTNAKTLVIKFTQPVLNTTVVDANGILKNITITPIATATTISALTLSAALSADGLTLTVTPSGVEYFNGNYALTVSTLVTDKAANAITAYSSIFSASDSVRPSVTGPTYTVNLKAHITFSEPIKLTTTAAFTTLQGALESVISITDDTGAAVSSAGLVTLAADNASFDLNMAGWHADKNYTLTIVGLMDFAGNLMAPNPTTLTVKSSSVDSVAPTVVSVVPTSLTTMKVTFSEAVKVTTGTAITYSVDGLTNGTATFDSTGTIATVTGITGITAAGVHNVTVANYSDLSSNAGSSTTRLVSFAADTTAPTYVSSQVVTVGTDQFLVVKYSKNVVANITTGSALTGTYLDGSSVTKAFTLPTIDPTTSTNNVSVAADALDSVRIKITTLAAGGAYSASVVGTLVSDTAPAPNAAAAQAVTFTVGTVVDSSSPAVSSVTAQATEDVVTVVFDKDVTAATALNIGNYAVEGVNVFKSAIFDGTARIVKLTLNPNTIGLTGNRLLSISNVTTAAGKTMSAYSKIVSFAENVKPTLVSAVFTNQTTITATFSEAVTGTGTADFEFYIDGVKQATTPAVSNVGPTASKTVVVTLGVAVADLSKAFTIKYVGSDLKDSSATPNAAPASAVITVTH